MRNLTVMAAVAAMGIGVAAAQTPQQMPRGMQHPSDTGHQSAPIAGPGLGPGGSYVWPSDACMKEAFHAAQVTKQNGGNWSQQEAAYNNALASCISSGQ